MLYSSQLNAQCYNCSNTQLMPCVQKYKKEKHHKILSTACSMQKNNPIEQVVWLIARDLSSASRELLVTRQAIFHS